MNRADAFESAIRAGRLRRQEVRLHRSRVAIGISVVVLVAWTVYVTAAGQWSRVGDHWASALTMLFGSFVAGSTPQGGGAVAFPVFTKLLDVDASVARTFSMSIQAVGMGTAAAAIVVTRRLVVWRAVALVLPAAIVGFLLGAWLLGSNDQPFWPTTLPGPYVKVTFTLLVTAMAFVVARGARSHLLERLATLPQAGRRIPAALIVTGLAGGGASWLVGSGADVLVYLTVVVLLGVSPRVGVPTSVVVMAGVSIVGFALLGVVDGQLDVGLGTSGAVVQLDGEPIGRASDGDVVFGPGDPLDAGRYDLFGFWLAAVPVVGFGAPLGSWVAANVTDRQLVRFVVALAAAETLSTIIFLDGLVNRPDVALIAYAIVGAGVVIGGLWALERHRHRVFALPAIDLGRSFTRGRLDAGPRFREQLAAPIGPMRDDGHDERDGAPGTAPDGVVRDADAADAVDADDAAADGPHGDVT